MPSASHSTAIEERDFEVAVVGGGPAGAVASLVLARWGHRVALLTRKASHGLLAESLPPSCGRLFDRVGIRELIDGAGFIRSTGNTVWWEAGAGRVERFSAAAPGYQVPRGAFDQLLLGHVRAAGARVSDDATVMHVERADGGETSVVHYESGPGRQTIRARWVLDCSGRAGLLARHGWRRPEAGSRTVALVGVWERDDGFGLADETHTLVESYDGGWAWSVSVSAQRRYVTLMVDPGLTTLVARGRLGSIYRAELARAPHLSSLVERATLVAQPWAREASTYSAARVGEHGRLLVGDAASFIDPLSSFGVKKAIASAWLASVVTHTCLSDSTLVRPALELYETRERAIYESLRRRSAELSRDAAGTHATDFWLDRATADDPEHGGEATVAEADVAALRGDPEVLAAFEELKRRPSLRLRAAPALQRLPRPTVRGNAIVLEPHLVAPAFGAGVRWLRSIDLVRLADLAPDFDQVPDLYEAYNRSAPPAPLPDFLGALSVLVGKRMLDFA